MGNWDRWDIDEGEGKEEAKVDELEGKEEEKKMKKGKGKEEESERENVMDLLDGEKKEYLGEKKKR